MNGKLAAFKAGLMDLNTEGCLWLAEVNGQPKQISKLGEVWSGILGHLSDKMYLRGDRVALPMPSGAEFKSAGIRSHRWVVVAYVRKLAELGMWDVELLDSDRPSSETIFLPLDRSLDRFREKQARGEWGEVRTAKPKTAASRKPKSVSETVSRNTYTDRIGYTSLPHAPTQLLLALFPAGIKASEAGELLKVGRNCAYKRLELLVVHGIAEKRGTHYFPSAPCASFDRRQEAINRNARQVAAARRQLADLRRHFAKVADRFSRAKNPPQREYDRAKKAFERSTGMLRALEGGAALSDVTRGAW
jgi:hypothetical protein